MRFAPLRYHGIGWTYTDADPDDLDDTVDLEVIVWAPCTYDNGFQPDDSEYKRTERTEWLVSYERGWDGEDWAVSEFEHLPTGQAVIDYLAACEVTPAALVDAIRGHGS